MANLGGNAKRMEQAADAFEQAHRLAAQAVVELAAMSREVAGPGWAFGPVGHEVLASLRTTSALLDQPTTALARFGTRLREQADQQRRASAGEHGGGDAGRTPAVLAQAGPGVPLPERRPDGVYVVVSVGNSYHSGEGAGEGQRAGRANYLDATDRRHRSQFAPVVQAAQRIQNANPDLRVEVHLAASSGAVTQDLVCEQVADGRPVNTPQLFQIPTNADVVVVEFGGNDADFGPILRQLWSSGSTEDADRAFARVRPLLDDVMDPGSALTADQYLEQAEKYPVGQAPTLVARLLQDYREIHARAPGAQIVAATYPIGVDPETGSMWSGYSREERERIVRELAEPVNTAIRRAAEIAGPNVSVADLGAAFACREVFTDNPLLNDAGPAVNEQVFGGRDRRGELPTFQGNEAYHPNRAGMAVMADGIGAEMARRSGLTVPPPLGDRLTPANTITLVNGFPDIDGDRVPDRVDPTPGTPAFAGRVDCPPPPGSGGTR